MNINMAYLIGMILGNGEVQRGSQETTVTIDIPHKNLYTDDGNDYLKDSSDLPIQDKRVFSFASNVYKIPFKDSILPPTNLAAKK